MLTRLGAFLRLSNEQEGTLLKEAAEKIDWSETEWLLVEEIFGLYSGINTWKRNPTYMPTVVVTLFNSTEDLSEKYKRALGRLLVLAKILKKHQEDGKYSMESPVCFNSLTKQIKDQDLLLAVLNDKEFSAKSVIWTKTNEVRLYFM